MKDFAVHITVREKEYEFDFWKFYLVSDEVAREMISKRITDLMKEEGIVVDQVQQINPVGVQAQEKDDMIKSQSEHIHSVLKNHKPEVETQTIENIEIEKTKVTPDIIERITERLINELKPKVKRKVKVKEKPEEKVEMPILEEKKELIGGEFYEKVSMFCKLNDIEIISVIVAKKDKEFDLVVDIPSKVGSLKYFMKAKDKDKLNETDVALAYSEGQMKKLPVILLSNGIMNKKADEYALKLKGYFMFKQL